MKDTFTNIKGGKLSSVIINFSLYKFYNLFGKFKDDGGEIMIYIVTGASGFLGNNIVKLLSMYGKKIRALVLPKDQIDFLKDYDIEIFYGDVTNKESLLPVYSGQLKP
jgi:hypothetical protein